jgi:hypothetical protein
VQRRAAVHHQDIVGQRNLRKGAGDPPCGYEGPEEHSPE